MGPIAFQIYTQFYLHRERICHEIAHELRQRSIEAMVTVLHKESEVAVQRIRVLQQDSSKIIGLQKDVMAGQADIEASLVQSAKEVEGVIVASAVQVNLRLNHSMQLSQNLSAAQMESNRKQELQMLKLLNTSGVLATMLCQVDDMLSDQLNSLTTASAVINEQVAKW